MIRREYFYMILGLLGLLSGLAQRSMFGHTLPFLWESVGLLPFVLGPLFYVLSNTVEKWMPLQLVRITAWIGGYWFMAAFYGTMLLVPFALLWAGCMLAAPAAWPLMAEYYSIGSLCVLGLIMLYGIWKAFHPVVRRVEISTDKPLERTVTIAFASDIHFGIILGPWFARRLVRDMNALQPDIILFGGDVIDGNLNVVARSLTFRPLRELQAKIGTWSVLGNHDNYCSAVRREIKLLRKEGVRILKDETTQLMEGLRLVGMRDALFFSDSVVPAAEEDEFTVVVDHIPLRIAEAAKQGADLYLSGHTHAGQFWPIRYSTRKKYLLDYGTRFFGKMCAITTSGYGAWGALFRTGPSSEIVLITVHPEME